ncbi:hypothetical protein D3C84_568380 [compost metagenome]
MSMAVYPVGDAKADKKHVHAPASKGNISFWVQPRASHLPDPRSIGQFDLRFSDINTWALVPLQYGHWHWAPPRPLFSSDAISVQCTTHDRGVSLQNFSRSSGVNAPPYKTRKTSVGHGLQRFRAERPVDRAGWFWCNTYLSCDTRCYAFLEECYANKNQ